MPNLNILKNHEILPFFLSQWKYASLHCGSEVEFEFTDLTLIKEELLRRKADINANANDELTLEQILYGTPDKPVFSGWEWNRLTMLCEGVGLEAPTLRSRNGFTVVATTRARSGNEDKSQSFAIEARRQRVWNARKRLRLKTKELIARGKAALRANPTRRSGLWLDLGAGEKSHPGYLKVDWGGDQHLYDDIVRLTKIKNGTVERIYSNHVLEHIPVNAIDGMLKRWFEVLAPGGQLRIRMPDAKQSILHLGAKWTEACPDEIEALGFPNYLVDESASSGTLDSQSMIQTIYGWSSSTPFSWDMSNQHKSLWTPELGALRLKNAGFDVHAAKNLGTIQTVLVAVKP